jgi:putative sugar O-methyltransferase
VTVLRRLLSAWRLRRIRRRLAGPKLIAAFAQAHPRATFVEVGANDGKQHDHLRPHILRRGGWTGVMVEPVPYVFERLRRNYEGVSGVTLVNAAIAGRDGRVPFFHLRDASPKERSALPDWYDGVGSLSRAAVLSHAPQMPDLEERLVESEVEALTFATLCERNGLDRVDLVVVDAEGHDWEIVRTVDLERHRPRLVVYEHFHLSQADRAAARAHLEAAGYRTMEEGFDTFALRRGDGDALDLAWERLEPAVPGVAKADEVPDLPLHDRSVPLPPGAEDELRDDNPRLVELREIHAAHAGPATAASRWSKERVDQFLDLRWFRGETLIQWHYRDDPEATERRYRALADHVRARDQFGFLDRLEEDGLFGCWTFQVEDGPRVSRDLLDSVLELTFLERAMGVSQHENFSVLDVGAGYGRLAHRAATAFPNLRYWCCVDGVPESTFLAEYYLRLRGVIPPAGVAALDEVQDLPPQRFDLAVNVHSFPEMPFAAVQWWLEVLADLDVPYLFVVPNGPDRLASLETDGSRRDLIPALANAGYELAHQEPAIDDPEVADLVGVHDRFLLYARR